MSQRTCNLAGCDRKHYAKDLCQSHYRSARSRDPTRPQCTQQGCDAALYARDCCRRHYCERYLPGYWHRSDVSAKHREINRRYHHANAARRNQQTQSWRQANPGKVRAHRERWRAANPERTRQLSRENQARRKARALATSVEPVDYAAVLHMHGMVCHLCRRPISHRRYLHFDHVIPLARGGHHVASNIRPAHRRCNLRKGSRLV